MKKLIRRMERVNTLIQIQSSILVICVIALTVVISLLINFDGINASSIITEIMPQNYHQRF
jgi:hypothetical protein